MARSGGAVASLQADCHEVAGLLSQAVELLDSMSDRIRPFGPLSAVRLVSHASDLRDFRRDLRGLAVDLPGLWASEYD